ncbi:hypothetical protein EGR_08371 [Echinococcus granulosus]|uniref:Uncharacterized protein n=1 Tax=Echinococcus granulosus TaxID=6210 RepID=W6U6D7_ECHGR|nr:hypothetical protein EGR_08371 [Echinococcus granulosus]EUB56793.1 hypothetical protein EGR_08371 [Echinococcus granulosus]
MKLEHAEFSLSMAHTFAYSHEYYGEEDDLTTSTTTTSTTQTTVAKATSQMSLLSPSTPLHLFTSLLLFITSYALL